MKIKLNLGCGEDYRESNKEEKWINLDCRENIKNNVKWDFNNFPYPFKSNSFDEVLLRRTLEHSKEPIKVLKELIRICKNKARIKIQVAHCFSLASYGDIQHHTFYTKYSFSERHLKEYGLEQLKPIKVEFVFYNKYKKYIPFKRFFNIYLNGIYDDVYYELEVNK